jgi:trehalose 6-phosphate synthase/phosphatase
MKTIFVSNRLPYELKLGDSGWESQLSVSGLVSGVKKVFEEHEGIWLGWMGQSLDIHKQNIDLVKEWEKESYYAVGIPTDTLTAAHEGFNNRSLWSLFHYFPNYVEFKRDEWEAYKEYNRLFTECILEHYNNGDVVFINDFQLMLVPQMLRKIKPKMVIKYFHHIPFPSRNVFSFLPVAKELIKGLLGADYVGFHTYDHAKNFERAAKEFGLKLGKTKVEANPIGIDPTFWEKALQTKEVQDTAHWVRHSYYNKKIILATERLDYTKGIPERLQAFEYLLETYPEWRENVVLIQIAVHSRQGIPIYQRIGERVDRAVGKLNGRFGRLDYTPIHYTNKAWTQEGLAGLYSSADVACVTPLIDGWNLVSNEFVASGNNNRALILSKFAGAASLLKDATIVNPYDIVEVGEAMRAALETPNVESLKPMVESNTIFDWADRALNGVK